MIKKVDWNCHDRFSRNTQIPNFIKIRPVGAELFHADKGTDMKKLIVALRNFANALKKLFRNAPCICKVTNLYKIKFASVVNIGEGQDPHVPNTTASLKDICSLLKHSVVKSSYIASNKYTTVNNGM